MADMWVRTLKETDAPLVADWIMRTKNNLFDADTIRYPETTTLCATKDGPVAFLPVQGVAMMESLATKPGASRYEVMKAIEILVHAVALLCMGKGLHEMYFLSSDPDTIEFAKRHGFDDMTQSPSTCPHCKHALPNPHAVTLRLKLDKIK